MPDRSSTRSTGQPCDRSQESGTASRTAPSGERCHQPSTSSTTWTSGQAKSTRYLPIRSCCVTSSGRKPEERHRVTASSRSLPVCHPRSAIDHAVQPSHRRVHTSSRSFPLMGRGRGAGPGHRPARKEKHTRVPAPSVPRCAATPSRSSRVTLTPRPQDHSSSFSSSLQSQSFIR